MIKFRVFEFHSNDNLVDEVERGLKKGYWDKALIPELKKRFKEIEKKEKLLELYKKHYKLVPFKSGLGNNAKTVIDNSRKIEQIEKELENDK